MPRILTLGGTFNPVHAGHLRLAIEAAEALPFDSVEWIPCFAPRHKDGAALLPFALRLELLRLATGDLAGHAVNDIESRLPSPSFTYQTLAALAAAEPAAERYFVLGQSEFARLHLWYRGRDLVGLTHLLVAARGGPDPDAFHRVIGQFWPDSQAIEPPPGLTAGYRLGRGGRALLLPLPQMAISSSLVRERWLAGRDLRLLVPREVLDELARRRDLIIDCWKKNQTVG